MSSFFSAGSDDLGELLKRAIFSQARKDRFDDERSPAHTPYNMLRLNRWRKEIPTVPSRFIQTSFGRLPQKLYVLTHPKYRYCKSDYLSKNSVP